jgi:hypothetical protein
MLEKVLLITTFSTPEEVVVCSVPKEGYRAAEVESAKRRRVVRKII